MRQPVRALEGAGTGRARGSRAGLRRQDRRVDECARRTPERSHRPSPRRLSGGVSLLACPLGSTEAARWTVVARSPSRRGDRPGAQANPSVAPGQSATVSFEVAAGRVPVLRASADRRSDGMEDLGPRLCSGYGTSRAKTAVGGSDYAMQFDHRDPATKVDLVTKMIGRASDARILAEAA